MIKLFIINLFLKVTNFINATNRNKFRNQKSQKKVAKDKKNLNNIDENQENDDEDIKESNLFNNSESNDDSISVDDIEGGEEEIRKDEYIYKQRKFNYLSELAIFAEYETLRKVLFYVRGEQILWNYSELNEAVFGFIKRIVNDLNADWIFFQMDFLNVFHAILSNEAIVNNKNNKEYVTVMTKIVQGFFKLLEKNNFLLCESFFR